MTIKTGDKIPSVTLKRLGKDGMESVDLAQYVKGKKVVLFAVPGAFTPACQDKHLPGYLKNSDKMKQQGVAEVICIAVNDPFVMRAWGEKMECDGKVTMMPDGNGEFTRAVGMEFDGSGHGLGKRSKRYSMIVDDGVVQSLEVEDSPGSVDLSSAETCLIDLKKAA